MSDLCSAGYVLFTSGAMRNHMPEADTYAHSSQYLDMPDRGTAALHDGNPVSPEDVDFLSQASGRPLVARAVDPNRRDEVIA
jgi:hypothetical protein